MSEFDERINQAMQRCADGSDEAFGEVYALMGPRLLAWFQKQGASREQAEDLLQEVAIRLYRARGNFQRDASAMAWAYGIARNAFIDQLRASRARPQTTGPRPLSSMAAPEQLSADSSALAGERARRLQDAMQQLPATQREAFELRHLQQVDIPEAARRLGVTQNAFKIRVHRALEALRRAFERDTHHDPQG
jgi:RNA polymerase sigma-70 factor (ECF subfamily)